MTIPKKKVAPKVQWRYLVVDTEGSQVVDGGYAATEADAMKNAAKSVNIDMNDNSQNDPENYDVYVFPASCKLIVEQREVTLKKAVVR